MLIFFNQNRDAIGQTQCESSQGPGEISQTQEINNVSYALQSQLPTQDLSIQKENSPVELLPTNSSSNKFLNQVNATQKQGLEKFEFGKNNQKFNKFVSNKNFLADSNSFHENAPLRTSTQFNSSANNQPSNVKNIDSIGDLDGSTPIKTSTQIDSLKRSTAKHSPITGSGGKKRKSNEDLNDSQDLAAKKGFFNLGKKQKNVEKAIKKEITDNPDIQDKKLKKDVKKIDKIFLKKKQIEYLDDDSVTNDLQIIDNPNPKKVEVVSLSGSEDESSKPNERSLLNYEKLMMFDGCENEQQTAVDSSIEGRFEEFMNGAIGTVKEEKVSVKKEKALVKKEKIPVDKVKASVKQETVSDKDEKLGVLPVKEESDLLSNTFGTVIPSSPK